MKESLKKAKEAEITGDTLNAPAQGILVTFQKILDPTSVVRESEYARSGAGQSLLDSLRGKAQALAQGGAGVTVENLEDFVDTAERFMSGYQDSLINKARVVRLNAEANGLREELILEEPIRELLNENSQQGMTQQTQQQSEADYLRSQGYTDDQI